MGSIYYNEFLLLHKSCIHQRLCLDYPEKEPKVLSKNHKFIVDILEQVTQVSKPYKVYNYVIDAKRSRAKKQSRVVAANMLISTLLNKLSMIDSSDSSVRGFKRQYSQGSSLSG